MVNCIAQMITGFLLEAQIGSLRMAMFFFTSGIFANLFGATTSDKYAAGAEPVIFAMISALVAMYIYHWDRLGSEEEWC